MDKTAIVIGNYMIGWHSVLLTMAVLTAVIAFQFFYTGRRGSGAWTAALSLILGILLARLVHWYCRSNGYTGFAAAMTDYSAGGYALPGAFAGCLLAAVLLRITGMSESLPGMLDAMCVSGSLGIALGRLSFLYSASDRGRLLSGEVLLPLFCRTVNPVSGAPEHRIPTFLLQAVLAGLLFLILALMYPSRKKRPAGDLTLVFLLLYGAGQILADSTRVDSLYFRSNGFVSVVQILCALAVAGAVIAFSVRLVKAQGMHPGFLAVWFLTACLLGGAAFMEYYVQRHGLEAAFSYTVMAGCLCGVAACGLLIRRSAALPVGRRR